MKTLKAWAGYDDWFQHENWYFDENLEAGKQHDAERNIKSLKKTQAIFGESVTATETYHGVNGPITFLLIQLTRTL